MGTIEEIIKAIDNKLIETGKDYLLLGQANQILVDQDIITISEQSNKILKNCWKKIKFNMHIRLKKHQDNGEYLFQKKEN